VDIAKASVGFDIDPTSSQTLQESLSRLGRQCDDELVMQCVTELAMVPMKPAEYVAAGEVQEETWRHFALNIPYYTHFTSPIRRYADVVVHRLLQATIDGDDAVGAFDWDQKDVHGAAQHCNDMRMAAKRAQERSDRVFLSLFLKLRPAEGVMGIVLSVGEKTFTVFVPSLGLNALVYTDEHKDEFDIGSHGAGSGKRYIVMKRKGGQVPGAEINPRGGRNGRQESQQIDIKVFTKLSVACRCRDGPPINVSVSVMGMWEEGA